MQVKSEPQTPLKKAVLEWYHSRRDWMELGSARSTYSESDRDRICKQMGSAESALEAEAAKLKESVGTL